MYKKICLTFVLGLSMLAFNAGCGKKDDSAPATPPEETSSRNDTVFAASDVKYGEGVNRAEAENAVTNLATKVPGVRPSRVDNSPVPGFYQVIADGEVLYVSNNGEFMFVGDVFNVNKSVRTSLTEDVRKQARLDVLNSIPESDMVVYTPESGKVEHTVTVFTDIDCGYCRKFHKEMKDYLAKNIKVRYMSFPRAGVGSESYNKARTVWCSKDRNKAMDDAKLGNDFKASTDLCDDKSVDNSYALVRKLGLRGTPALLLDDGSLLPGYMPADRLRATLDRFKEQQTLSTTGGSNTSS